MRRSNALSDTYSREHVTYCNWAAQKIDSLAVLPFANVTADPNSEYLSDGITENLIRAFHNSPDLAVRSRSSVFRYKGKDVDAQKAGNDLGLSALVTGRVTQRGDTIQVSAELANKYGTLGCAVQPQECRYYLVTTADCRRYRRETAVKTERHGEAASHEAKHPESR